MIPSFGVKKAQPAFQVKTAAINTVTAAVPSVSFNSATTPSAVVSSKALPAEALIPTPTLPPAALPPRDAEAEVCNSDEDFEKENVLIDPKTKMPVTKPKKLKVKKDPDAPKKPATSYMFFCKQVCSMSSVPSLFYSMLFQERQNVMNELGNIGFTATGAELARR